MKQAMVSAGSKDDDGLIIFVIERSTQEHGGIDDYD